MNEPTFRKDYPGEFEGEVRLPAGRRSTATDLASVLALNAALGITGGVPIPGFSRAANQAVVLTRRQRAAATAKRSQALDGRVYRHRMTGEIRAAHWRPDSVEFLDPKTGTVMLRPHHKALSWCSNADDITPAGAAAGGES